MTVQQLNSFRTGPDEHGHFGIYGGRFVAETLMPLILELENAYAAAKADPEFKKEMDGYLTHYVGRPSPLYFAERLTEYCRQTASGLSGGGAKIYLKREELNHTGAHKVNNVLGQILLARRMGKKRIIAETGAGMHGVATATLCARFGLECIVYMGSVDVERQKANVFRMNMLGAKVVPVESGAKTLKDAMNEALRDWVTNVGSTFYCIGTIAGPHPYPMMVRDFQSIIGRETREQMLAAEGRLPDSLIACIGGGSNAMGLFHPFLDDKDIEIYGVEAAGHGLDSGMTAASVLRGRPGVLHGNRTYLLMNEDGQINEGHSISAGLDYPGIGPEHSWLKESGRVTYLSATARRRWSHSSSARNSKGSSRRSNRRTPSPRCSSWRRRSRRTTSWWSISPAAATRTSIRWRGILEAKRDDRAHRAALCCAPQGRPLRTGHFHHGGRSGLRVLGRDPQGVAQGRR